MRKRNAVRGTAISVGGATGGAGYTKDNIYSKIGVRTFINLTATYTINGSTLLLPEVRQSMDEASRHSVNMDKLMEKVGARIARLLGSEVHTSRSVS